METEGDELNKSPRADFYNCPDLSKSTVIKKRLKEFIRKHGSCQN